MKAEGRGRQGRAGYDKMGKKPEHDAQEKKKNIKTIAQQNKHTTVIIIITIQSSRIDSPGTINKIPSNTIHRSGNGMRGRRRGAIHDGPRKRGGGGGREGKGIEGGREGGETAVAKADSIEWRHVRETREEPKRKDEGYY